MGSEAKVPITIASGGPLNQPGVRRWLAAMLCRQVWGICCGILVADFHSSMFVLWLRHTVYPALLIINTWYVISYTPLRVRLFVRTYIWYEVPSCFTSYEHVLVLAC